MKAPDKIHLSGFQLKTISIRPSIDPNTKDFEYIRKDALLEWLKECKENPVITDLQRENIQDIIDKINSL